MEQVLHALAGILLKATPTILLVLVLHWYLKAMLFRPLAKVLQQRDEATAGARRLAEQSLQAADRRAAEFEQALVEARADVYRGQEALRKQWLDDQAEQIRTAKENAGQAIAAAKADIDAQTAAARHTLAETSSGLADDIARTVLEEGRA